jgi:hypothetical protein
MALFGAPIATRIMLSAHAMQHSACRSQYGSTRKTYCVRIAASQDPRRNFLAEAELFSRTNCRIQIGEA